MSARLTRKAGKSGDGERRVSRRGDRRADEERVRAGGLRGQRVVHAGHSALGDGDTIGGNAANHARRGGRIDDERLEIPIVHPDHGGADVEGALQFGFVAHFHKNVEAGADGFAVQRVQRVGRERPRDQQHGGRSVGACLPDLDGMHDEILAQHRNRDGRGHGGEVLE